MAKILRNIKLPKSRLSWRTVSYVFISVIVIETIILIPSYLKRERELLDQLRMVASAQIELMMSLSARNTSAAELFAELEKLVDCDTIVGGALYTRDGQMVGVFGEAPELSYTDIQNTGTTRLTNDDKNRFDSAWSAEDLHGDHVLILRQDAANVARELTAYTLRIIGLIVIISLFVTAGAWLALDPIVVRPILRLRQDLIRAGDAISRGEETPEFYSNSFQRKDELGEVITAFNQMVGQITEAISEQKKAEGALQESLRQIAAYSRALDQEMERGRQIQTNFLPTDLPRRPGWEFETSFKPARRVAGDFFDVFNLPGNSVGLVIADVCDKGVGAALFMALIRSLIRIFSGQTALEGLACRVRTDGNEAAATDLEHPDHLEALKAVQLANDYILKNHEELAMFATLFFGVLDPESGGLTYVNAGHNPLYILKPGGGIRRELGPTGPAVGIQSDIKMEIGQARLSPGDILFGYTDGVTEARADDDSFFSESALLSMLAEDAASAKDLLNRIASAVKAHSGSAEQFDDITMLAVRRRTA
jgi:serine phosphatase RsbU (regulator of sigma subunit)